jgi:hypothetical protein
MTIALVSAFIPAPSKKPAPAHSIAFVREAGASMADAADFRRIALSFEGAGEYPHFDRRAFKARVTFATLAPDELSANIKFAPDEQALKCMARRLRGARQRLGRRGGTRATLAALSEAELKAALDMAWRHAAPKAKPKRRAGSI